MRPIYPHAVVDRALSAAECAALIALAHRRLRSAATHYPPSYRDNERMVQDDPALARHLMQRLRQHLPTALTIDGDPWDLDSINPRFRLCRYQQGQRFRIHRDGVHYCDDGRQSLQTFMVYLNDASEFEGGDTRFFAGRRETDPVVYRLAPAAGRLVVFDHAIWHDGAPVHRGQKLVLRSDLLYRRRAGAPEHHGHRGYVWRSAALSGGLLATSGRDKTVRIWHRGEQQRVWRAHDASVTALTASPSLVFTGSRDGMVRAWTPKGQLQAQASVTGAVLDARWTGGGLVTTGADGVVRWWSPSLTPLASWQGHTGWVWAVRPDGDTWLTAGEDGTARRWGSDGRSSVLYRGPHPITAVCAIPGGFASGDSAGTVRVHRNGVANVVADHRARVRDLLFELDLYSCGEDDEARRIDIVSGAALDVWRHDDFVTSLCCHQGGVVSTSYDGSVRALRSVSFAAGN